MSSASLSDIVFGSINNVNPDKTAPQGKIYQGPHCLHACEYLSASSAFDTDLFQSLYMIWAMT